MTGSDLPPLFFVAFAAAWAAGLGLFACLFVATRRMGMEWGGSGASRGLDANDTARLAAILWGLRAAPAEVGARLVWAIRGLFAGFVALVVTSMLLLSGAV